MIFVNYTGGGVEVVISRTPFRISFFGGGTDYPVWYQEYSGAVLSATIDKYCYINIRYLPPFFEHKHRIVYSMIEDVKCIDEIRHPVVRALLELFKIDKGLEIHHDGDLPARSGLGSSSAFTVGMLNSLHALRGNIIAKNELAKQAIHIERDILKENVGSQDQIAVSYGGFNKIIFHNDHNFRVEPMTLQKEKMNQLQNHLMLIFTGLSRLASEIATEQIKNTSRKKNELTVMRQMVDCAIDILNSNRDIIEFGKLLHESWQLKKTLSNKISSSSIDALYDRALRYGAIGGKLLGAGGGGFMLLFVTPEKRQKVKEGLKEFLEVKFAFENEGSQIIYYNPQEA
jgi:D-glycero-alpha-D-manno-heptose-7-phosphate kinase